MSLNRYMHPRNIYKTKKPRFEELAEDFEFFREVSNKNEFGKTVIDFKIPSHVASLSKALLMKDFGLNVDVPHNRLIPTVPLRFNYILWIEDVLKGIHNNSRSVNILDIGVGASCIYPLLGAKCNKWNFYGTEIDLHNYTFAKENVKRNNLQDLITLYHIDEKVSSLDTVFQSISDETFYLDAVISNPPFFSDALDAIGSDNYRSLNRPPPKTLSVAAPNECQTFGGEVHFCMRLALDSLRYSTRVGVFTIMLGRKCSLAPVRRILHKLKIPKISVYEICQGRIMRWGVSWSFLPHIQFPESEFRRLRKLDRPPCVLKLPPVVSCLPFYTVDALLYWLINEFKQLDIKVLEQKNRAEIGGIHLLIVGHSNTWTHSRRKRREAERMSKENGPTDQSTSNVPTQPHGNDLKRKHDSQPDGTDSDTANVPTHPHGNDLKRQHDSQSDGTDSDTAKRICLADVCEEAEAWMEDNSFGQEHQPPIIKANVFVEYVDTDVQQDQQECDGPDDQIVNPLVIKIAWLDGTCREAPNQIVCYLRNRLK